MTGLVADIGERTAHNRRVRPQRKLAIVAALMLGVVMSTLIMDASASKAAEPLVEYNWQAKVVTLPQTSMSMTKLDGVMHATYKFVWNQSYDFSALDWSAVDETRTDRMYVLGLGAKIWVLRASSSEAFPIEITQGDGTSLDYVFTYAQDRETPHIYLTGERTFWRWDRTPDVMYDYRASGSCLLEDAWTNGSWSPEEGITLSYALKNNLALGKCDFQVQLYVYDVMMPEFELLVPVLGILFVIVAVAQRIRAGREGPPGASG